MPNDGLKDYLFSWTCFSKSHKKVQDKGKTKTMKTYTLYVGFERDGNGNKIPNGGKRYNRLLRTAASAFGGYSESKVSGAWLNPATNKLVKERSGRIELMSSDPESVSAFATLAKRQLRQNTIIVVENKGEVKYIV